MKRIVSTTLVGLVLATGFSSSQAYALEDRFTVTINPDLIITDAENLLDKAGIPYKNEDGQIVIELNEESVDKLKEDLQKISDEIDNLKNLIDEEKVAEIKEDIKDLIKKGDNLLKEDLEALAEKFKDILDDLRPDKEISFKDVKKDAWYYDSVMSLVKKGYINGYEDETFRPDNKITREETAQIIYKIASKYQPEKDNKKSKDEVVFKDIDKDRWSYDAIKFLKENDIVKGRTEDEFFPEELLTREEASVMASRVLGYAEVPFPDIGIIIQFKDSDSISDWAKSSVNRLAYNKIITGYEDNTFKPKGNITRAEFSEIMNKVSDSIESNRPEKNENSKDENAVEDNKVEENTEK